MMKIGPMLGKIVTGESVIREFSTVGLDDQVQEKVYLRTGEHTLDISGNQWLLGLDPRIIGVWIEKKEEKTLLEKSTGYKMYFMNAAGEESRCQQKALAVLELDLFTTLEEDNGTLFLLRVLNSGIRHVNSFKARLLYWKFYKKPGVSFDRLKGVAAAYTYPRRVRIISFKQDSSYNYIFPMDLLGDIRQSGRYLLGMRHSNKVLTRIMDEKKIVVSEVPAQYKPLIYQLGRNHSASPPPLDQLSFGVLPSREFGFYIPEWAESYKEIHIRKTVNLGSHMLLFGEWTCDNIIKPPTPRLHHIHFLHFLYQKHKGTAYPVV
ncbi:MAG TPA: hypothetical protein VGM30_23255 [Puia sp.]|jgi:hypothetical protein